MSTLEEHEAEQAEITAACEAGTCDHANCREDWVRENATGIVPTIPLDDIEWTYIGDDDDPKNRLLATIKIGPLHMHLEAVEVVPNFHDAYDAKYEGRDNYLQTLMDLEEVVFERLEIDGRFYVIWATPFGE